MNNRVEKPCPDQDAHFNAGTNISLATSLREYRTIAERKKECLSFERGGEFVLC